MKKKRGKKERRIVKSRKILKDSGQVTLDLRKRESSIKEGRPAFSIDSVGKRSPLFT